MKFHINKKTLKSGECTATKEACPLGENTPHFNTLEEAQNYIEKTYGNSYSIFSSKKNNENNNASILSEQWFSKRKHEFLNAISEKNNNIMNTVHQFVQGDIEECIKSRALPSDLSYSINVENDDSDPSISIDVDTDKTFFQDKEFNLLKLNNGYRIITTKTNNETQELLKKLSDIADNYNTSHVVKGINFKNYYVYSDMNYRSSQGHNDIKDYSSLDDNELNDYLNDYYLGKYEQNVISMIQENNSFLKDLGENVDNETVNLISSSLKDVEVELNDNYKKSVDSTFNLIRGNGLNNSDFKYVDKKFFNVLENNS